METLDLKVRIKECSIVHPFQETQKKCLFLTNIDQILNFSVETLHFFPPHNHFPPHVVIEKIKATFSKLLVPYHFLAGRLKLSHENGRLEIDCNGAGAGFVVASSDITLDEIGDLVYPNPAFQHLVSKSLDVFEPDDQPLVIVQVLFHQPYVLSLFKGVHMIRESDQPRLSNPTKVELS